MSIGAPTTHKRRLLADAVVFTALSTGYPTFSGGGITGTPRVFAGDMMGTYIHGVDVTVSGFAGFTSVTPTFETSHDGVTWVPWFAALTAITADGTVQKKAEDDFEAPMRFVRFTLAVDGAGTATLTVALRYHQHGPRGAFAPPGTIDRY